MKRNRLTREWRQKIHKQCKNFKAKYFYEYAINEEKSIIYSSEEKRLLHFTKATVEHIVPLCELVDTFLKSRGLDRTAKLTGGECKIKGGITRIQSTNRC
ncbi:hypothetical protein THII_2223 [Thioploca ingrica]|uniref:Uncharacterized protein n=1 Tax=Thioploca ingrica TaxID=40754 RepID=A0A090AML2_9GAMM|nr:hypothetical protein THII_2223 [Thioploca ingrica]